MADKQRTYEVEALAQLNLHLQKADNPPSKTEQHPYGRSQEKPAHEQVDVINRLIDRLKKV